MGPHHGVAAADWIVPMNVIAGVSRSAAGEGGHAGIEARDVAQGNSSLIRNQQVRSVHCAVGARKIGCRADIVKPLIERRPWA